MSNSVSFSLRNYEEQREKMNKLIVIALAAAFLIADAQNPAPTVADSIKTVTIPSMAQMPIPPPGSPSSQSIPTKNVQSEFSEIESH